MNRILLFAALILMAVSCASESSQRVPLPDQTQVLSNAALSRVYVCRMPQTRGSIRSVKVFDGIVEIGTVDDGDYLCWERVPRHNPLRILYEGPVIDGGQIERIFDIDTAAGEVLHLGIEIDHEGKPFIVPLEPSEGARLVSELQPAPVAE